jgi:hypothetical protein
MLRKEKGVILSIFGVKEIIFCKVGDWDIVDEVRDRQPNVELCVLFQISKMAAQIPPHVARHDNQNQLFDDCKR